MAVEVRAAPVVSDADPMGLLNKYALPKVAMGVITTAAAVGTVLSTVIGGGNDQLTSYIYLHP